MNNEYNYNEKTTKEKVVYVVIRILRIVFWVCLVYFAFLSFKTGEFVAKPLVIGLLMVPVGIYNIISARNRHQESDEDRKKFNKIVLRSILLSILIVTVVVVATVLYAINKP